MTQEIFPRSSIKPAFASVWLSCSVPMENMVKAGEFPPSVRIGKHVFWSEVAVRKWQRTLFAAQEAWQP